VAPRVVAWAIWSFAFDGEGNETADNLAWSSVLVLLAGALAALAATLSVVGIWTDNDDDTFIKTVAVLWILTLLAYFLVPVLQRFTSAGVVPEEARVLAVEGDVERVATRAAGGRAIEVRLEPGERLVLRRR
jgi:hypothetical protein